MNKTQRFVIPILFALFVLTFLFFSSTTRRSLAAGELNSLTLAEAAGERSAPTAFPVVADFESGNPPDWFTYGGQFPATNIVDVSGNMVLDVSFNVTAYGGFGAELKASRGERDWSAFNAAAFEFTGNNSGIEYKFQLQDAEGGGAVERWFATFTDDFVGTRTVYLPFSSFQWNGFQDGGPVNDGFQTSDIAVWLFDLPLASGTFQVDNVRAVNYTPPVFPVVADFEAGVPAGWFNFGGENPTTNIITASSQVLDVSFNVSSYGGFGAVLSDTLGQRDWSGYDAVAFEFTGNNSGIEYKFQIQDAEGGGIERWFATFTDDFVGQKTITLPWSAFAWNGYQEGGPTDDGLQVTDIEAWLFDLPQAAGAFQLDNVRVIEIPVARVGFASNSYSIIEGGSAEITVSLTMTSTDNVTVEVSSADGTATSADYTSLINEQAVIPAGQTTAVLNLLTTEDSEDEALETVTLTLTNTDGVELTISSAVLSIIDNDEDPTGGAKVEIIDDFESALLLGKDGDNLDIGFVTWSDGGAVAITTTTEADAGIDAAPGSSSTNKILKFTGSFNNWGGGFTHAFENDAVDTWTPMNWSFHTGVAFWFYGVGDGQGVWIDIAENRSANSTSDDAERWTYSWTDDTPGWQFIQIGFDELSRKEIGNGAPDDGWSGEEIHGWAFGMASTGGAQKVRYLDNFGLLERISVVDDFTANPLPFVELANQVAIGYLTWKDGDGSSVVLTTTTTADAGVEVVPGTDGTNEVLKVTSNIVSWGGFTHAFENQALDAWVTQDWSTYEGICFWLYGTGSGTDLLIEISENRNPGSDVADAETWSYTHDDTTAGWQLIQLPFDAFLRKNINNGAPDDGWSGKEVHGWSFGSLGTGGEEIRYIDGYSLYGYNDPADQPLEVQFGAVEYNVSEGDVVSVTVELNKAATEPVTVTYRTADSYAIPDRDFVAANGTVVIPAGALSATIAVETIEDQKFEATEVALLTIDSAETADLGFFKRTRIQIINDDAVNADLVEDFEGWHPLETDGMALGIVELAEADANALPGQNAFEQVLAITPTAVASENTMTETFVEPVDWSGEDGLSFWYKGTGSGDTVTVSVLDNAAGSNSTTVPTNWVEVWSQEFDEPAGTLPDSNVWSYELNDGFLNELSGWGNSELQYYTRDAANAATDGNGNLVVTLNELTNSPEHCHYGTCTHTSARLISENKVELLYGEIEARIKVPSGPAGLWPAFWMLGTDIREVGWPQTGEIDIMEYVSRLPNEVFGTLHGPGYSGGSAYGSIKDMGGPVSDDYHTFRIVWQPDDIKWYVDDILYHTAVPTDVNGEWVYNHPFYLILNLAIGGTFGGQVDAGMTYPQEMLVDYIRVKGAADSAERFESSFVDDTAGWRKVSLPFSAFTRSATQPAGAPDDGFGRTEVNGYTLSVSADSGTPAPFCIDQIQLGVEGYKIYLPIITNQSAPASRINMTPSERMAASR